MLRKNVRRCSQMVANAHFKISKLPVVAAIGLIALGAPAHSQVICNDEDFFADVRICCDNRDDGDPNECSVRELRQGVGSVSVNDVQMTVNTLPEDLTDDRVFVTAIGEGTDRPGLEFEVRDSALELDACSFISDWYRVSVVAFRRPTVGQPIDIVDVTLAVEYSGVHTGSGPDFDGAYLNGFMIDTPNFPPNVMVDFFTPDAAAGSTIEPPPPGAVTLPATLKFRRDDPVGFEDVRIDIGQTAFMERYAVNPRD